MIELTVEERARRILDLESMRDSCIASIEGLRSGNHKIYKRDAREEEMQNMFSQVEFQLEREAAYRSSLKNLEKELREAEAKP